MTKRVLLSVIGLFYLFSLTAQNLVPNPQFELTTPSTADFAFRNPQMECYQDKCNPNLFRFSPAANWTMWLGSTANYACVMAELVKAGSNCVPPWPNYVMGNMMHVKTTVGGSGIVNSDIPADKKRVRVTSWVYVVKGTVVMSYGPTGVGLVTARSVSRCKWEKLEVVYDGLKGPANQITLYADNKADAEFYTDAVSVLNY